MSGKKLEEVLIANGHEIVGGTALFVLSRPWRGPPNSGSIWRRRKILTRSFPGKPDWLRFGLPAWSGRAEQN